MTIVIGYYKDAHMYFVRIIKANGGIVRSLFNTNEETIDFVIDFLKGQ